MNPKTIKILLIGMLIVSILYFWYCYSIANTIDILQALKSLTRVDPLWWIRSVLEDIINILMSMLKQFFGIV